MMKDKLYAIMQEVAMAKPIPQGNETHQRETSGMKQLLTPGLRKIFFGTYTEVPEQYSQIFHVKNSSKDKEEDVILGAMSPWGVHGGTGVNTGSEVTADMPSVQYQKMKTEKVIVYRHETFSSGFQVQKELVEDEKYGVINKMPKELARAGRAKVEMDAISVLNEGFPTGTGDDGMTGNANPTIYDGKTLFNAKHPLGEDNTKFCSNLMTGALSDATLIDAEKLGSEVVDEAGKKLALKFDTLIVPKKLEHTAKRIVNSTLVTGSNNNDTNTLKGSYKVVVNDYLTSDVNWFLQDSKSHELNFFWRVRPSFNSEEDFDTYVFKYAGRMRYSFGVSNWRGIIGVKGA